MRLSLAWLGFGSARPANHVARLGSVSARLGQPTTRLGFGLGSGSGLAQLWAARVGSAQVPEGSGELGSARPGVLSLARHGSARKFTFYDVKPTYLQMLRETKVQLQLGLVSTRLGFDTLNQPASRLGSARLGFASVRPANQPARLSLGLALGSGLAQLEDGLALLGLPEGSARLGSALEAFLFFKLRESSI